MGGMMTDAKLIEIVEEVLLGYYRDPFNNEYLVAFEKYVSRAERAEARVKELEAELSHRAALGKG
jgi:hypothetical protein